MVTSRTSNTISSLTSLVFILSLTFFPHVLVTTLFSSAMPPLFSIYPPSHRATSLPGLMARFLAGWEKEEQRFILNVLSVILAAFLSFSAGRWAISAETNAILHALKWCISYSSSCNFESTTLFSDYQSMNSLNPLTIPNTQIPY